MWPCVCGNDMVATVSPCVHVWCPLGQSLSAACYAYAVLADRVDVDRRETQRTGSARRPGDQPRRPLSAASETQALPRRLDAEALLVVCTYAHALVLVVMLP